MAQSMLIVPLIVCLLAFWMGYSVNQGGTCAVATASELVKGRRPRRLVGLVAASATAALAAIALQAMGAPLTERMPHIGLSWGLVAAGMVFGVGALINDACLLGSLSRFGSGEMRVLALPVGLVLGFAISERLASRTPALAPLPDAPAPGIILLLAGWLTVLLIALAYVGRGPSRDLERRKWPLRRTMIMLGLSGGTLCLIAPIWSYTDLARDLFTRRLVGPVDSLAVIAVTATVAGAIASAARRRRWRYRRPTFGLVGRTILGGALMGMGASLIPGGNDALVLAAIPALSIGGTVAYLTMTATMVAGLFLVRRFRRKRASGPEPAV